MRKIIIFIIVSMLLLSSCAYKSSYVQVVEHSSNLDDTYVATENNDLTDSVTTDSKEETAHSESSTEQSQATEIAYNDTLNNALGGTDYCDVHHAAYHMIPGWLIDYIGVDKYEQWQESLIVDDSNAPANGCNRIVSIKTVIDYFNIPENIFSEYCIYPIDCVYNLNVLYHGTEEDIDRYYRDTEYFLHDSDRSEHYDNYLEIIWFDYEEEIAELGLNKSLYNIFTLSTPEVVQKLNITRVELEGIFKKASDKCIRVHGVCYTYDYNFDMIYGEDGVSFEALDKLLAVNEDDDLENDISSNELREMFCRVGRYAE